MSNVRQVVLETLRKQGPLPIEEIAHSAKLSTLAMRYHLGILQEQGLITAQEGEPCGVGRPAARFALADCACAQLPQQYGWLSASLLGELNATIGEKRTRGFLRDAGKAAAQTAGVTKDAPPRKRVERAAKFLNQRGYMAGWKQTDDGMTINICNCPYQDVARQHPELCEMDSAMIGELVGAPVEMQCCMLSQSRTCEFRVSVK
ncbi:MAG: Rrf2 family transcriptional regulator [Chloroflexi bacterium]|nr:Rrf2 family transcriptional regulator [Chloroflexota bacterium]